MKPKAEEATELAIINILFARAELVTFEDPSALFRAIELLDQALSELTPHAPHFGTQKGSNVGGANSRASTCTKSDAATANFN